MSKEESHFERSCTGCGCYSVCGAREGILATHNKFDWFKGLSSAKLMILIAENCKNYIEG